MNTGIRGCLYPVLEASGNAGGVKVLWLELSCGGRVKMCSPARADGLAPRVPRLFTSSSPNAGIWRRTWTAGGHPPDGRGHEDSACGGQWVLWGAREHGRRRRTREHYSRESLLILTYSSGRPSCLRFHHSRTLSSDILASQWGLVRETVGLAYGG